MYTGYLAAVWPATNTDGLCHKLLRVLLSLLFAHLMTINTSLKWQRWWKTAYKFLVKCWNHDFDLILDIWIYLRQIFFGETKEHTWAGMNFLDGWGSSHNTKTWTNEQESVASLFRTRLNWFYKMHFIEIKITFSRIRTQKMWSI